MVADGPLISRGDLNEEDWKKLNMVVFHLAMMEGFIQDFSDSLALIDHTLKLDTPHDYEVIRMQLNWSNAARFFALFSLYHFHTSLKAVRELVRNNKALKDRFDFDRTLSLVAKFEEQFPNLKIVRDAAGHQSDRAFKPEDVEKHGFEGRILPLQFWNGEYGASHEGNFVGIEMWEGNIDLLMQLRAELLEIFADGGLPDEG